ncbi:MAG TPA: YqhV family protein [Calditerricola sp.]
MFPINPYVTGMAATRLLSGSLEVLAALLILRYGRVDRALEINAALAAIGPLAMMTATAIGLAGLAGSMPPVKLALILGGAALILIGTRLS